MLSVFDAQEDFDVANGPKTAVRLPLQSYLRRVLWSTSIADACEVKMEGSRFPGSASSLSTDQKALQDPRLQISRPLASWLLLLFFLNIARSVTFVWYAQRHDSPTVGKTTLTTARTPTLSSGPGRAKVQLNQRHQHIRKMETWCRYLRVMENIVKECDAVTVSWTTSWTNFWLNFLPTLR